MSTLTIIDFDDTLCTTECYMDGGFYPALMRRIAPHRTYTMEQLRQANAHMYLHHGASIHGWAEELGLGMDWVLETFAHIAPSLAQAVRPHIAPNPQVNGKLRQLQKQGHTLAILTHGHRDYVLPLLEHLELAGIFPPEMVFDISAVNGHLKRTVEPYRHVLNALAGTVFLRHNMVEDSPANLPPAKQLGFTTWLVGEKPVQPDAAPFIDHRHPTLNDALDVLLTK